MASKTGALTFAVFFIGVAPALAGQESPLQWPVPPPGPPRQPVFPEILMGVEELAGQPAAEVALLDVRGAGPYARGHLPGAAPAWRPEEETPGGLERVRALLAERGITGDGAVVLYGDADREAVGRLFWLLHRAGCPRVRILDGGLAAWQAAGLPLETGASRRAAAALRLPAREAVGADAAWVAAAFGQPGTVLLDVRDARGWDRWETPPVFGAGHIPHSLPFDPRSLLPAGEDWPEPAALRRRLAALGPRPGDPVPLESTFVLYGEDWRDPRIGLGYLLLTLAGLEARVFGGGWREWTADGTRPVVRVISAAELATLLQREGPGLERERPPPGMILLDLREARDFAIGHLPGARGLPYRYRSFAATFEAAVAEGWPDADRATVQLILYCYGPDCIRSRDAAAQAARLGFRNTFWFRGGVTEWRGAGLPLPAARAWRERASPGSAAARRSP
jgi:thiosulfate/3-mercaptopyruvate sulfurtransferase